jgi:hypothetical protein
MNRSDWEEISRDKWIKIEVRNRYSVWVDSVSPWALGRVFGPSWEFED